MINERTFSESHFRRQPTSILLQENSNSSSYWCNLKGAFRHINSGLQLVCLVPVVFFVIAIASQIVPLMMAPILSWPIIYGSVVILMLYGIFDNSVTLLLSDGLGSIALLIFSLIVIALVLAGMARVLLTPCMVLIGKDGIREYFIHSDLDIYFKTSWRRITGVYSIETERGNSAVCFNSDRGSTMKLPDRLLTTAEERRNLLDAISQWAPHVHVDEGMLKDLASASLYPSYTELWLDAVIGNAGRRRMAPLSGQTSLQNARFTIQRKLGAGGQAIAYLAEMDDNLMFGSHGSRQVVLKEFILPDYDNWSLRKEAVARMQHEASMLMRLSSPSIVSLLDFFIEDHRGYLVLEHIEGRTLRKIVESRGSLPETLVRNYAAQMCDILIYLHAQSPPVVHRDFTPDNLILTSDGKLKLIDFNVAQEDSGSCQQTSISVGKPSYTPPEQLRGKPLPASDIYAFGATLAFLLIGEDPEPLEQIWLQQFRPDISETMHRIVLWATAQDHERRWQSLSEAKSSLCNSHCQMRGHERIQLIERSD